MSVGRRNCSAVADGFVSEEPLSLRNMLSAVLPFLPLLSSTPSTRTRMAHLVATVLEMWGV